MQFQKVQKTTILDYPKHLVIYAKPKIGKTDLVSRLPDCGIIDIEGGSDYIKGYIHVVKDEKNDPIQTLKNLDDCLNWLIAEKPYKYEPHPREIKRWERHLIQDSMTHSRKQMSLSPCFTSYSIMKPL